MPISRNSSLSNEKQYVTFSVDKYENSVIQGILAWGKETQGKVCIGLLDFIDQMERIFEAQGAPVASVNKRLLISGKSDVNKDRQICNIRNGKLATFAIQVQYRQNASWQGRMVHKETKEKYVFRSFKQLMNQICSVLENKPIEENVPVVPMVYVEQLVQDLYQCLADENQESNFLEIQKSYPNSLFGRYTMDGRSMSFGIRLKFKANASWQGMIYWKELRQEITFRSFLELVLLIAHTTRHGVVDEEPA